MSLYSTIKKIDSANKRAIRNAEKRRRELQRMQKERERLQETEAARLEVEIYENTIEVLRSVHKECSNPIDWYAHSKEAPPFNRSSVGPNEKACIEKLNTYKPSMLDKLFGRTEARKKIIKSEIQDAKLLDNQLYKEWEEHTNLACNMVKGKTEYYLDVLKSYNPLQDLSELGSHIDVKVINETTMEVILHVHSEEVIPKQIKSLTSRGKLSEKNMPKGVYYELYQDYVCGAVLRIAREIFALLPVEKLYIHAMSPLLDTSTGLLEEQTILTIDIPKNTLVKLNFEYIDCSDSIRNFNHVMKFNKTSGFKVVENLTFV